MAKWIAGAIRRPGAFTAKAKAAGKGTADYAREEAHAPGRLGKQARLALTLGKLRGRKKAGAGGSLHGRLAAMRASGAFRK